MMATSTNELQETVPEELVEEVEEKEEEIVNTEQVVIEKLRTALEDVIKTNPKYNENWFLLSYLENHRFKQQKAEAAVRESIKWRNQIHFERLVSKDFDAEIKPFIPLYFDGVTPQGNPVITVAGSNVDHRGIVAKFGVKRYTRFWYQILAKIEDAGKSFHQKQDLSKAATNPKFGVIIIVDFLNYSFYQARSIRIMQCWAQIGKNISRYCSTSDYKFYLLNVNKTFKPLLKIFKRFLQGPCIDIQWFDTSDPNWEEELMDLGIDRAQIRPRFGGTKVD